MSRTVCGIGDHKIIFTTSRYLLLSAGGGIAIVPWTCVHTCVLHTYIFISTYITTNAETWHEEFFEYYMRVSS